jgi:hypothetical protein
MDIIVKINYKSYSKQELFHFKVKYNSMMSVSWKFFICWTNKIIEHELSLLLTNQ